MLFVDHTKRSASELLVDLSACRQLRHISENYQHKIIEQAYIALARAWMGPKAIKHPNPNNPCTNCGQPRSKFNYGPGLCYRCYGSKGISERDLWIEDVFLLAVEMRGYKCDACDETCKGYNDDENRNAVINMLDSMDGAVKPALCRGCLQDFKCFCTRRFGKASWRHAKARDLEKMILCWVAQKVKSLAERVKSHGEYVLPRKRRQQDTDSLHSSLVLDWRTSAEISSQ